MSRNYLTETRKTIYNLQKHREMKIKDQHTTLVKLEERGSVASHYFYG